MIENGHLQTGIGKGEKPTKQSHSSTIVPMTTSAFVLFLPFLVVVSSIVLQTRPCTPTIKFTGGGINFWWQAGVCQYLAEQRGNGGTNPNVVQVEGASAGALAATLLVSNSSFEKAADIAISLAHRNKVFDKRLGLYGIWGNMVNEWLDELLPDEITSSVQSNLFLAVTPFPRIWKGTAYVSGFQNKNELIEANMASTHIPYFMNKKATAKFRGRRYIDGSFWTLFAKQQPTQDDLLIPSLSALDELQIQQPNGLILPSPSSLLTKLSNQDNPVFVVDWRDDDVFRDARQSQTKSFVSLITPDGLYEMMEFGYQYMKRKQESGEVPSTLFNY